LKGFTFWLGLELMVLDLRLQKEDQALDQPMHLYELTMLRFVTEKVLFEDQTSL
jgi:hypothetical protein